MVDGGTAQITIAPDWRAEFTDIVVVVLAVLSVDRFPRLLPNHVFAPHLGFGGTHAGGSFLKNRSRSCPKQGQKGCKELG